MNRRSLLLGLFASILRIPAFRAPLAVFYPLAGAGKTVTATRIMHKRYMQFGPKARIVLVSPRCPW